MTTAYCTDSRFDTHTLPGHPENATRLQTIRRVIHDSDIVTRLTRIGPVRASDDQIRAVHTQDYLDMLRYTESLTQPRMLTPDTYILPESFEIARYAAGGGIAAVDAIMRGETDNALVVTRPPGHHATSDQGMGFCLLNNVAITARYAQQANSAIKKVLIVDYDVHHGNGTQDIFYADPSVLSISTHQSPWYPNTGRVNEIGTGAGLGSTLNLPLRAGTGDACFELLFDQVVWPIARRFAPDLILVSAGFDAHWAESNRLGQLRLSLSGYAHLSAELKRMAAELCGGRIAFVLEGGYNVNVLANGVLNIGHILLGDDPATYADPFGLAPSQSPIDSIAPLLAEVKRLHQIE